MSDIIDLTRAPAAQRALAAASARQTQALTPSDPHARRRAVLAEALGMAEVACQNMPQAADTMRAWVNQIAGALGLPWKQRANFVRRVDPDPAKDTEARRQRLTQALGDMRDRLRKDLDALG